MNWPKVSAATLLTGLLVGGARLAVRHFVPTESAHSHASSCGALRWRTRSVTRQSSFDPDPVVVSSESVIEVDGATVLSDVDEFRCAGLLRPTGVASLRNATPPGTLYVFEPESPTPRPLAFQSEVASFSVSPESVWLAVASPAGAVSVARVDGAAAPARLGGPAALAGTITWLDELELCFVSADGRGTADAHAELWCSKLPEAPRSVKQAGWTTDVETPWVGVAAHAPHLCGEGLVPRDPFCIGRVRPER